MSERREEGRRAASEWGSRGERREEGRRAASEPRGRAASEWGGRDDRGQLPAFIEARRSIRAFTDEPVARAVLDRLVTAACLAPAPHHSRPWRWVVIDTPEGKQALADGMGAQWRIDLGGDGVSTERIDELVDASTAKLTGAPALVLGCLTRDGLDRYPDDARRRAEWGMALLSLGAGVENLMLTAADAGLASCWVAAPIFCPEAARDALALPDPWSPAALVLVGHPSPMYTPRERPAVPIDELRVNR